MEAIYATQRFYTLVGVPGLSNGQHFFKIRASQYYKIILYLYIIASLQTRRLTCTSCSCPDSCTGHSTISLSSNPLSLHLPQPPHPISVEHGEAFTTSQSRRDGQGFIPCPAMSRRPPLPNDEASDAMDLRMTARADATSSMAD
jgi:hypothetical protein